MNQPKGEEAEVTKQSHKVMLGRKSNLPERCRAEGLIGADFNVSEILSGQLDKTPLVQGLVHIEADVRDFVADLHRVSCQ